MLTCFDSTCSAALSMCGWGGAKMKLGVSDWLMSVCFSGADWSQFQATNLKDRLPPVPVYLPALVLGFIIQHAE